MNRHWWTDGQNRWNHTSPPLVSNTRTPNHPHHTTSTHGCIFTWALPKELVPSEGSKPSSFARGMTLIVPKSSHLCCLEIFQQIPIHSSVSLHVAVMVWFRKLALQISTCAPRCFKTFIELAQLKWCKLHADMQRKGSLVMHIHKFILTFGGACLQIVISIIHTQTFSIWGVSAQAHLHRCTFFWFLCFYAKQIIVVTIYITL